MSNSKRKRLLEWFSTITPPKKAVQKQEACRLWGHHIGVSRYIFEPDASSVRFSNKIREIQSEIVQISADVITETQIRFLDF